MKKLSAFILVLIFALTITACGTPAPVPSSSSAPETSSANTTSGPAESESPVELTVSAAASLTEAMNQIVIEYASVAPNVTVTVNYGSSGALQSQIENGAPADIFFSAATKQMDALNDQGLMASDTIINLLKNEIVLVVPPDSALSIGSFLDAATDTIKSIAIGDIASVPVGQYAQETFTSMNIWDEISAKAIYGSDVKQVLSWVNAGDVDCGVVYSTDAAVDGTVKVVASAPADTHKAIVYPVGIVKASTNQTTAADFISYLQSEAGLAVFKQYGFLAG